MADSIYINFDDQRWIPEKHHTRAMAKRDTFIRELLLAINDDSGVPTLLHYYEQADQLGVQLYERNAKLGT